MVACEGVLVASSTGFHSMMATRSNCSYLALWAVAPSVALVVLGPLLVGVPASASVVARALVAPGWTVEPLLAVARFF